MCSDTVGCVRNSASAAREKLPSSATLAKISRRRRSMPRWRGGRLKRRTGRYPVRPTDTRGRSVAGAASAAATARTHRRGDRAAIALETEHGELAAHLAARARRAGNRGGRGVDVLLEVLPAAPAAVLVDGHPYS